MPFCPNCGRETAPGTLYCIGCGKPLQGATPPPLYAQPPYYQTKDPAIAAILSLLIAGVGQMYVGRILRGIVILLAPLIFAIFIIVPAIFIGGFFVMVAPPLLGSQPPVLTVPAFFASIILLILIGLGYHVWNIFDAYNLAKIYNQQLEATGRPPW